MSIQQASPSPFPLLSVLGGLVLGSGLVLLLACGGGGGGGVGIEPAPFGLEERQPLATLGFPDTAPNPTGVGLERAFDQLFFNGRPIFFTTAPDPRQQPGDTAWLYVAEQNGQIHVFPNDENATSTSILLDLSANSPGPVSVSRASNEEGLLGLAFDPAFATNGYYYVHYSASGPRRSVIARYRATFPTNPALPPVDSGDAPLIILTVSQPFGNHNAGMLAFGPDDMFYVAMGDGGAGDDPQRHGQNLNTLLGSLLRIDVRGATAQQPYSIPGDNPFVGQAGLDEIWAYGLRNPWRFSFDRDTGEIWLGDVGQGQREEIDVITRGANYGWVAYEGELEHLNGGNLPRAQVVDPIVAYGRTQGSTVVGGYRYRGQDVPTLRGAYVYGDYGSTRIWALVPDGQGGMLSNEHISNLNSLVSFGEDERGELYAVSLNGTLHRFTEPSGTPPPALPGTLSATGLFTDVAALTPASGLIEYDVNAPLWSDDAVKRRWIGVPDGFSIQYASSGPWGYPVGTVLVKHFELELTVGDPGSRRRLETRVMLRDAAGWSGYTYRWNDAQTDADLLPGALTEDFTIQDVSAPGGQRTQTWAYPSRAQCLSCHTPAAGHVLGVRTGQINRAFDYGGVTDNQLRAWNHIGLFQVDIGDPGQAVAWPHPADANASLAARARAYLASNCAQCHLPDGPAPGELDLRYTTPDAQTGTIGASPTEGFLGLGDPRIIDAGLKENSVLWLRMQRLDTSRMPKIGSSLVDDAGSALIGEWIDGLPR
ncbi:MAG: PQQ-dependent sugar dehydrogenase [Planctomycetota bacterium]|nr:PQQ-dependent sugar dehydrogenase [Planctomycetota bacterium]